MNIAIYYRGPVTPKQTESIAVLLAGKRDAEPVIYWDQDPAQRSAYHNLLSDAEAGRVDTIVSLSLCNFSTNIDELLVDVRKLIGLGISTWFVKENFSTASIFGKIMFSMISSMKEPVAV